MVVLEEVTVVVVLAPACTDLDLAAVLVAAWVRAEVVGRTVLLAVALRAVLLVRLQAPVVRWGLVLLVVARLGIPAVLVAVRLGVLVLPCAVRVVRCSAVLSQWVRAVLVHQRIFRAAAGRFSGGIGMCGYLRRHLVITFSAMTRGGGTVLGGGKCATTVDRRGGGGASANTAALDHRIAYLGYRVPAVEVDQSGSARGAVRRS
jgi:hypothetical protein